MENYEQKYKEVLGWMRSIYPTMQGANKEDAEHYFPELLESEDERIRKELIERFNWELKGAEEQDAAGCSRQKDIAMFKRGIAWLEKQGEQKSSWSEEDEKMIDTIIYDLERHGGKEDSSYSAEINWLKSLKDRVQPQQKQELSEEDEKIILSLHHALNCADAQNAVTKTVVEVADVAQWLFDCKERFAKPNHWKPSEQNIKDLEWCADLVKDKMGVGFHRLQVFIDELRNL